MKVEGLEIFAGRSGKRRDIVKIRDDGNAILSPT
jgi:hypothetical protein